MASALFVIVIPKAEKPEIHSDSEKDVNTEKSKDTDVQPNVTETSKAVKTGDPTAKTDTESDSSTDLEKSADKIQTTTSCKNTEKSIPGQQTVDDTPTIADRAAGDGALTAIAKVNATENTPVVSLVNEKSSEASYDSEKTKDAECENKGSEPATDTLDSVSLMLPVSGDKQKDTASNMSLCSFLYADSMEETLRAVLSNFDVQHTVWTATEDKKYFQVTFVEEAGERCEGIINQLVSHGIGKRSDSTISVIPVSIHVEQDSSDEDGTSEDETAQSGDAERKGLLKELFDKKSEFSKSVKARIAVHQVVVSVRNQAALTFDFIMLVVLASCIACLGLVENSSVILVASMLVSPLMGPILAITFGTSIKNAPLRNYGFKVEMIALGLCLICGFLFGIIAGLVNLSGANWGGDKWPTNEMQSRGMARSLWVGILVAIPSGAGVALSVLGSNIGSLVGVAISASLLPPAVNAGMLWSFSLLSTLSPPPALANTTSSLACPALVNNHYSPVYSCNMAAEAALLGIVSLVLTLLNIVCVIFMGIIILKVKEVAPHTATSTTQTFWKDDIRTAREYYQTLKTNTQQTQQLGKRLMEEWNAIKTTEKRKGRQGNEALASIIENAENDPGVKQVAYRLPGGPVPMNIGRQVSGEDDYEDRRPYRTITFLTPKEDVRYSRTYNQHDYTLRVRHRSRRTPSTVKTHSASGEQRSKGRFQIQRILSCDNESRENIGDEDKSREEVQLPEIQIDV